MNLFDRTGGLVYATLFFVVFVVIVSLGEGH